MPVIIKDRGYAGLVQRFSDIKKMGITIGVHAEEGSQNEPNGATVAEVATYNEFGMGVPERSFIRAWADENAEENNATVSKAYKYIAAQLVHGKGVDPVAVLDAVAQKFAGQVQQRISSGIAPENAPSTIAQKRGSTTPLINTGQLRSSIMGRVEGK